MLLLLSGLVSDGCGGCSGDDTPCPPEFKAGDRCEIEDLVCPFPGAKCESTVCTCTNQPGGFFWECTIEYCYCTCFCGKVAINSCEILECSTASDPCPASAATVCAHICADAGVPDARPEDLQPETETGADQAVDTEIPDEGPGQDLPVPDVSPVDTTPPSDTVPPLDTSPE